MTDISHEVKFAFNFRQGMLRNPSISLEIAMEGILRCIMGKPS
jgi:hypothetical protein